MEGLMLTTLYLVIALACERYDNLVYRRFTAFDSLVHYRWRLAM